MKIARGPVKPKMALLAGAASLATVAILIVIKAVAYVDSGSASVLASLLDSAIDASVSLMTFLAIRFSLKPADRRHRHGHGKVEGLAALLQAAFIGGAGVFLLLESASRFSQPHLAGGFGTVVTVMLVSTALSALLIAVQKYSLTHAPSLAVEADRAHYSSDIVINIGVIVVMLAIRHGAPGWIDPAFALGVAIYLAFTVRAIAGQGIGMLMDRELSDDIRDLITRKAMAHEGVLGVHDLRTTKSGMRIFISFDMEADPDLSLREAHEIVREVEHGLLEDFPGAEILIHLDPHGDIDDSRHPAPEIMRR